VQKHNRKLHVTVNTDKQVADRWPQKSLPGQVPTTIQFLAEVFQIFLDLCCTRHSSRNVTRERQVYKNPAALVGCVARNTVELPFSSI
jgi:hypothetical protein